jgi:hypothetical protein
LRAACVIEQPRQTSATGIVVLVSGLLKTFAPAQAQVPHSTPQQQLLLTDLAIKC